MVCPQVCASGHSHRSRWQIVFVINVSACKWQRICQSADVRPGTCRLRQRRRQQRIRRRHARAAADVIVARGGRATGDTWRQHRALPRQHWTGSSTGGNSRLFKLVSVSLVFVSLYTCTAWPMSIRVNMDAACFSPVRVGHLRARTDLDGHPGGNGSRGTERGRHQRVRSPAQDTEGSGETHVVTWLRYVPLCDVITAS